MKRIRFLSIFVLIGVFAGVVYAGIFAASSVKKVNIAGSINIPANILDVRIEGFLGSADTSTNTSQASFDTATPAKFNEGVWEIPADYLTFDLSEIDTNEQFNNLEKEKYLTIRITNYGSHSLTAHFTQLVNAEEVAFTQEWLSYSGNTPILKSEVDTGTTAVYSITVPPFDGTGTTTDSESRQCTMAVIKLKFSLLQLVEEDINNATFSYNFKLDEVVPNP